MTADPEGHAKRVRVYLDESDKIGYQPAHVAIVQFLRNANGAGATVFRGIEGFGGSGELHSGHLVDVQPKLPLVIEWVDSADRVDALLGRLKEMAVQGLITVEDTQIVLRTPHSLRRVSARLSAGDIMSRDITAVERSAPVLRVVELLLGKTYRAVPVVADGKPVGIITNSDLVSRGGLDVRMELLPRLDRPVQRSALDRLAEQRKTAADIMTPEPVTVHAAVPLPQVADLMARRRLKRLPVTDGQGKLVGIVSRFDLLRSVAEAALPHESDRHGASLNRDLPLSRIMRRDVPTVHPDTPVGETLQAVVSTRLNRAVVVDESRRVVGIVSDAELLERVTPSLRTSVLRSLMHRLPFVRHAPEELAAEHHASARVARDLMSVEVTVAAQDTPLHQAIADMVRHKQKLIAVVDQDQRLVGVVDRADILRGLAYPS
jgi:CBS domain-containing protein